MDPHGGGGGLQLSNIHRKLSGTQEKVRGRVWITKLVEPVKF